MDHFFYIIKMELPTHCAKKAFAASDHVIIVVDEQNCRIFTQDLSQTGSKVNITTIDLKGFVQPTKSYVKQCLTVVSIVACCLLFLHYIHHHKHCGENRLSYTHLQDGSSSHRENESLYSAASEPAFLHQLSRDRRQASATPPFAHLKGPHIGDNYAHEAHVDHYHRYMLWKRPHVPLEIANVGESLVRHLPVNRTMGLLVTQPGLYLVYSQVAVHGRETRTSANHYDCSHTTMKISPSGSRTVLMKSMITQLHAGFRFRTLAGHRIRPTDTASHAGVFFLAAGDEVRVGFPMSCNHVIYKNDDNNAYFGLIKLGNL